MGRVKTKNQPIRLKIGMANHLLLFYDWMTTTMETMTADDSLVHRKKRRRTTQIGKRRHWTIWAFFILATAVILYKAFNAIEKALIL